MSESEENTPEDAALPLARIPQLQPLIDFLPPWGEATTKQKMRLIGYSLIVYLPVALLILVVIGVLACYCFCLLWPMAIGGDDRPELYFWHSSTERREAQILAGVLAFLQLVFLILFLISFYKASFTNPGHIPDSDDWDISAEKLSEESPHAKFLLERKLTTGAIRTCSRCNKVKPDRCHHCRLCDQCVLKMDHHCPWISNCVGFYNYKYFFLMVTYGMLSLWVFEASFWMAVIVALRDDEVSTVKSLGLSVVYLLCGVLATALTLFWLFHLYLISQAITTVEFCEKRTRKSTETQSSPYIDSLSNNFRNALGQKCLLWFLPCCTRYIGYRKNGETGTIFKLATATE